MSITEERKHALIEEYKTHDNDTGSPEARSTKPTTTTPARRRSRWRS
jgi:hypothetical protein